MHPRIGPAVERPVHIESPEKTMTQQTEIKGRVKEAAGDLTDDKELQREGKADQTAGKVKEKLNDAVDKVRDAFDRDGRK